jgi:hypothetical protein
MICPDADHVKISICHNARTNTTVRHFSRRYCAACDAV